MSNETRHKPENPPAFPAEGGSNSGLYAIPGMSLRDYFAARAMQTMIAGQINRYAEPGCDEHCAQHAYRFADAMLVARANGKGGGDA